MLKDIYSPFKPEEISAKISELLTPKDMQAPVEIVFQSIENLHKACPNNLGRLVFYWKLSNTRRKQGRKQSFYQLERRPKRKGLLVRKFFLNSD